RIVS
ncbi:hypothetical protein D018_4071B, partial [Vibrio parahaemolyticus VP2007-007]